VTVRNRLTSQGFDGAVAVGRVAESPEGFDSELEKSPESRAFLVRRRTGGESGIRTHGPPLDSASCRFHNATLAVNASDAVAPCTGLHRRGSAGEGDAR
jgi:hypothetical protein